MPEVIKQTIKYQEYRTSQILNAHNKDNYGRHRGIVLYGMQLSVSGSNTLQISSGALYTPFGTKIFIDGNPTMATVTVGTSQGMGPGPRVIAVVARLNTSGANGMSAAAVPAIETVADISGPSATLVFEAKRVNWSRSDASPERVYGAIDPIAMNAAQTLVEETDTRGDDTAADGLSLAFNEILLGYVTINGAVTGTPNLSSNGVSITQCKGLVESLSDALGFDPLLGVSQNAVADTELLDDAFDKKQSMARPLYGVARTTDWSLNEYRLPSFLRDGDSILDSFRRLDFVLRLWLNRTGDQQVLGAIDAPGALPKSTQDLITELAAGFGSDLQQIAWGRPTTDDTNQAVKDGTVPTTGLGVESVTGSLGDSSHTAISAINRAIWHILADILGVAVPMVNLRDNAVLPQNATNKLQFKGDGPLGILTGAATRADIPKSYSGNATSPYLNTESVYEALQTLAQRAWNGPANLLLNPAMAVPLVGAPSYWEASGSVDFSDTYLAANESPQFRSRDITMPSNTYVWQDVTHVGIPAITDGDGVLLSLAAVLFVHSGYAGTIQVRIEGYDLDDNQVFRMSSNVLDSSDGRVARGLTARITNTEARRFRFVLANTSAAEARIRIYGTHMGFGMPPAVALGDVGAFSYVSRDGGDAAAMRGHLVMDNHKITELATPTAPSDAATKDYVDDTTEAAVNAIPTYTGTTKGLVPAGDDDTTRFLREDGAWAAPADNNSVAVDADNFVVNSQLRLKQPDYLKIETGSMTIDSSGLSLSAITGAPLTESTIPFHGHPYTGMGDRINRGLRMKIPWNAREVEIYMIAGGGDGGKGGQGEGSWGTSNAGRGGGAGGSFHMRYEFPRPPDQSADNAEYIEFYLGDSTTKQSGPGSSDDDWNSAWRGEDVAARFCTRRTYGTGWTREVFWVYCSGGIDGPGGTGSKSWGYGPTGSLSIEEYTHTDGSSPVLNDSQTYHGNAMDTVRRHNGYAGGIPYIAPIVLSVNGLTGSSWRGQISLGYGRNFDPGSFWPYWVTGSPGTLPGHSDSASAYRGVGYGVGGSGGPGWNGGPSAWTRGGTGASGVLLAIVHY